MAALVINTHTPVVIMLLGLLFTSVPFCLPLSSVFNQRKLSRLLKYLQFRDYKSKLIKSMEEEEVPQETGTTSTKQPMAFKKMPQVGGKKTHETTLVDHMKEMIGFTAHVEF